jgi:ABC-type phosphate/phosphonate transport system substrate-binding protein
MHRETKMKKNFLILMALAVTGATVMAGCSEDASSKPKTAQEVKDFKGGPPPPEAQAKIREMMQKGGGPGGAPPQAGQPPAGR